MFQPGSYKDGVLGDVYQPGSYRDGSLGILSQPGSFNDGVLGLMPATSAPIYMPGARYAQARGMAAAAAARRDAARAAALRANPFRGLGFTLSDVPTWGWVAAGLAVVGAGVYLLKK